MGARTQPGFDFRTFFLTIVLSFFIAYVFILYRLGKGVDFVKKRVRASNAYKQMKTGDIVTVSYNSTRGKMVKVFTGSVWTHSGLVVISKGEKYIIEIAHYGPEQSGIIRKPLSDWFDFNGNRVLGWRPYTGKYFPYISLLEKLKIDENRDITPDTNLISWLKTMVKIRHNDPEYHKRDEYYCSEYIIHLLQEIGVIEGYNSENGLKPASYKPWELLYGNLPVEKGHSYGVPSIIEG